MLNRLSFLWEEVRASLWFVPALIVLCALAAAVALIELEGQVSREALLEYPRLFGAGAEGSRGMLQAIAGSMITVAGVTFSITIVALSLASSQYTPRILRNFMSDRPNQAVLGSFVGIFTYCLVVMRTIRGEDEGGGFVPSLAVAFAVVLALVGMGLLIYFIHHTAQSIQASSIIASAAEETVSAVERLFPQEVGEGADGPEEASPDDAGARGGRWVEIASPATGYVQGVDVERLVKTADELGTVLRMERGVGDFVTEGGALLSAALDSEPEEEAVERLQNVYAINRHRTVRQDAAFGIQQIVDIALKALSTGVNDTTTAVTCVDYLSDVCARAAGRRIPDPRRYSGGRLRVVARGATFESLLDDAFDQIRESSVGNTAVILRILRALETIARRTSSPGRLAHVAGHAERVRSLADRSVESQYDRARIEEGLARLDAVTAGGSRALGVRAVTPSQGAAR